MTKRIRKTFTEEERHRCWQLWRQGLGYSEIAREICLDTSARPSLANIHDVPSTRCQ